MRRISHSTLCLGAVALFTLGAVLKPDLSRCSLVHQGFGRGRAQEPHDSTQKPKSDTELRKLVARQRQELMGRLVRHDASQLSGNAGFLTKLDLDPAQHRALGKIMTSRQAQAESIIREARAAAARTNQPEQQQHIADEAYRQVARLAEESLDEFKDGLLPHQVDQLEQLLAGVRLQAILQVAQLQNEPWDRVAAAELELSPTESARFHDAMVQAIQAYQVKLAEIRSELMRDLRRAPPDNRQEAWTQMLGNEPGELAGFLIGAGLMPN